MMCRYKVETHLYVASLGVSIGFVYDSFPTFHLILLWFVLLLQDMLSDILWEPT